MTATSNIALKVPFSEKDQAKSLGARWNAESKHWYVPQGVDSAPFEKWFTNAEAAAPSKVAATAKAVKTAESMPSNVDVDDINAMLRDAYESREEDLY
jgi:pantothenate kinase-related protein Tda10